MSKRKVFWALACLLLVAGQASASSVIGLSIEDQARLSKYVVLGEVTALRGVVHPEQGIETEVTLVVHDVLRGDVRRGAALTFHTRGGEVDGVISDAAGEAVFRPGQNALVFIEEIDGRLYNLGLSMGVWEVLERAGQTFFTRAVRDGLEVLEGYEIEYGPISYSDMVQRVRWAERNPEFDHPMLREARLAGGR